jgi:hypothetical protein
MMARNSRQMKKDFGQFFFQRNESKDFGFLSNDVHDCHKPTTCSLKKMQAVHLPVMHTMIFLEARFARKAPFSREDWFIVFFFCACEKFSYLNI